TVHRAVLPATTPDRATDFLGLGVASAVFLVAVAMACLRMGRWMSAGFRVPEEGVELLFEIMVADAVVQFLARLHQVDDVSLVAVAPDGAVDGFGRLVHGPEGRERIKRHPHPGAAQFFEREQGGLSEFGDVGQYG